MILPAALIGLASGAAMGVLMRAAETSRIAFGPYALYGNGALVVPVVLTPLAIYGGWLYLRQRGAGAAGLALHGLALAVATGVAYGILTGDARNVAGGIVGTGGLLVLPIVALAAIALGLLGAARLTRSPPVLAVVFVTGAVAGGLPPLSFLGGLGATGLSAGAAIALAEGSTRSRAGLIGLLLFIAAAAQAFVLPLLVSGLIR